MRADHAIRIVAKGILENLAEDVADGWGLYPEIGEHDWERVVAEVERLAPPVGGFAEAYALLESRAEKL
jgi:hypothetical protein